MLKKTKLIFTLILFGYTFNVCAIETIEINDSPLSVNGKYFAGNQKIITKTAIKNSGATTIADILKQQATLQVRDQYGDGSRVVISMRGFGDNAPQNTLILLNGKQLNNPLDIAAVNLNQIPIQHIKYIEILNGSGGVLWGDEAVGGIINIVTEPEKSNLSIRSTIGSYDYLQNQLQVAKIFTPILSASLFLPDKKSDNYRQHNQLDSQLVNGQVNGDFGHHKLQVSLQHFKEELELPGGIFQQQMDINRRAAKNFDDYTTTDATYFSLGHHYSFNHHWRLQNDITAQHGKTHGDLSFFNWVVPFEQQRHSYKLSSHLLGEFNYPLNTSMRSGIELSQSDYQFSSPFGRQDGDQHTLSAFSQFIVALSDKLTTTTGFRFSRHSTDFKDSFSFPKGENFTSNQWAGELSFNYQLNDHIDLYLRSDKNFRYPKLDEHIGQLFGTTKPLKTQTGISYELGANFYFNNFSGNINLYQMRLKNEIAFDSLYYANRNLEPTMRQGFDVSLNHNFTQKLSTNVGYSYRDARFSSGAFKGNQIPLVAKHHASAEINFKIHPRLSTNLQWQYTSPQVPSSDDDNFLAKINGYHTINTALIYDYKHFEIGLRINNLFNKNYINYAVKSFNPYPFAETAFYPAPKRQYLLSIQLDF